MTIRQDVLHYYRQKRIHQNDIYVSGGGTETHLFESGKVELTYASAPYGEHALSAYLSAIQSIAFRKDLSATVKQYKKRRRAAKRGWKTHRAQEAVI